MKQGIFYAAVFALLSATPAAAATYVCAIEPDYRNHFVPTRVVLDYDEASGQARVIDGIILRYVGNPMAAQVRSSNDVRLLSGWTVPDVTDATGKYIAGITYALNIVRSTGAASITGLPQGYVDHWRGSGTCNRL